MDTLPSHPEVRHSADTTGLVYGYHFQPGRRGEPLDAREAARQLELLETSGAGFVWLHFDLSHAGAEKWMRENLRLPEAFAEMIRDGGASTRIEHVDDTLLAVVNDVLYDFSFEATHIATLVVGVDRRLVVTARRKPLRAVERLRTSVRNGEVFRSPFELLVHLMRDQADVLVAIVRDATGRVDGIEDTLLADRLDAKRGNLGGLRRVLVRLRRLLAPEPAALFRLLNRPPSWMLDDDVQEMREAAEEFSIALSDQAALLERIKLLQEEVAAHINEQNNRLLLLLSIVTVLGLPFTIVGGLFGMNVGGIPLNEHRAGFWIIVGGLTVFTAVGTWLLFRRRR